MAKRTLLTIVGIGLLLLPLTAYLIGCSDGGGTSATALPAEDSSATGSVAVLLADSPDDYDNIWITITEVSLIPAAGTDGEPVIVYQSDDGCEVDLLDCKDEDYLLTVNTEVATGTYDKVRLRVSDIEVEGGGPCSEQEVKLPSEKIDLIPTHAFEVSPEGTVSIRLDIDADKSFSLHEAGQSGKCIFRPVIFVDIAPVSWPLVCPKILKGEITEIHTENDATVGFTLGLGHGRGSLEVTLSEDVVVFGENGTSVSSDELASEQTVWVRGQLTAEGKLDASVVVIGEVFMVKGTVEDAVSADTFPLMPDQGQAFVDGPLPVTLLEDTLILLGCNEPGSRDDIQEGMRARVVGKYSLNGDSFLAIAVLLRPAEITGQITAVYTQQGGTSVDIDPGEDDTVTIFLPTGAPVYLEGDGFLGTDFLCEGQTVRAVLEPDRPLMLTASELVVESERVEGAVNGIDLPTRIITVAGRTVHVQPYATMLDTGAGGSALVSLDAIETGDWVKCFGVESCLEEEIFEAFVVVIVPVPDD